jgi:hypothetical protein
MTLMKQHGERCQRNLIILFFVKSLQKTSEIVIAPRPTGQ